MNEDIRYVIGRCVCGTLRVITLEMVPIRAIDPAGHLVAVKAQEERARAEMTALGECVVCKLRADLAAATEAAKAQFAELRELIVQRTGKQQLSVKSRDFPPGF